MRAKHNAAAVIIAAAAILIAALASILLLFQPKRLVIENADTGQVIFSVDAPEGLEFSISFKHSVNKSDVEEYYRIHDGAIYVTACRYYAFGAGVATEAEAGQTLEYLDDGSMLLSGFNTRIDDLRYFFSTVYDHYLHIDGETVNLSEIGGKGISAKIYVK